MIDKKELIKIITESQKEKVDQEIEDNPEYKNLENKLKEELKKNDNEYLFDFIGEILIKTQDLAYKRGLEDGLSSKEIIGG